VRRLLINYFPGICPFHHRPEPKAPSSENKCDWRSQIYGIADVRWIRFEIRTNAPVDANLTRAESGTADYEHPRARVLERDVSFFSTDFDPRADLRLRRDPRDIQLAMNCILCIYYKFNGRDPVLQDPRGTLFSKKGRITSAPSVKIDMNYNSATPTGMELRQRGYCASKFPSPRAISPLSAKPTFAFARFLLDRCFKRRDRDVGPSALMPISHVGNWTRHKNFSVER